MNNAPEYIEPPTPLPRKQHEPTRRRLSLNLTRTDYQHLAQLAGWQRATIHQTVSRAVAIARRVHSAIHPEQLWPDLPPDQRPLPGFLVLHQPERDGSVTVIRLESL